MVSEFYNNLEGRLKKVQSFTAGDKNEETRVPDADVESFYVAGIKGSDC
jgi:hypothetical protein